MESVRVNPVDEPRGAGEDDVSLAPNNGDAPSDSGYAGDNSQPASVTSDDSHVSDMTGDTSTPAAADADVLPAAQNTRAEEENAYDNHELPPAAVGGNRRITNPSIYPVEVNRVLTPPPSNAEGYSSDPIYNRDWPLEDLSTHPLPRATLMEQPNDLIYEAIQIDQEQLNWWKKQKGQRLILIFILAFLTALLVVIFIGRRSSNNGPGVITSIAPSIAPSMHPSSCDTYRLVYRGALFGETSKYSYPYLDIDGDDAVVGTLLFEELLFFSDDLEGQFQSVTNVLEGPSQSVATSTVDIRSFVSVAISDGVIVAGVRDLSSQVTATAHVFEHDFQGTWKQTIELDKVAVTPNSVDIDGDLLVVAGPSDGADKAQSIHIYRHVNTTWVKEGWILDPNWEYIHGVSVKGNFAAVGISYHGDDKGAVFVFKFDSLSKSWNQFNDPITNDDCDYWFGSTVILVQDTGLLIRCRGEARYSGMVYFYAQSGAEQFAFQQKIVAPGDKFGGSDQLAADDDIVLVVTTQEQRNIHVLIYAEENRTWTEVDKIPAPVQDIDFGLSVAISGRKALISSRSNVYSFFLYDC